MHAPGENPAAGCTAQSRAAQSRRVAHSRHSPTTALLKNAHLVTHALVLAHVD
jgi:hypothetical protein